jgi:hypothetical protein
VELKQQTATNKIKEKELQDMINKLKAEKEKLEIDLIMNKVENQVQNRQSNRQEVSS